MPSQKVHNKITEKVLGKPYSGLNVLMDLAWYFDPGSHREIWGHDPRIAYFLFLMGEEELAMAVLLHLVLDQMGENNIKILNSLV